jgi:hypothetical protein
MQDVTKDEEIESLREQNNALRSELRLSRENTARERAAKESAVEALRSIATEAAYAAGMESCCG